MTTKHTGHCYCGEINFETNGDPIWISHCHCESCRRHSGSAMTTFAGFRPGQVAFNNPPSSHSHNEGITRQFCSSCGSPIAYLSSASPDEIHLYLGLFDDLENLKPQDHSFYNEKASWLEFDDDLPKYERMASDLDQH